MLCLSFLLFTLGLSVSAACSHSSLGAQYSDAAHPHAVYRICNQCGENVYTGAYVTKNHGDGSWGSGTCPDCGNHTYGPIYSEADHPHAKYQSCACGDVRYTGGYAVKSHGDGSWGSGTCPDCGSHTYSGRSCTTSGVCYCGATVAPSEHVYGASTSIESGHPHRYYKQCIYCDAKQYTGSTATYPHGDGSSNTCRYCGSHSYSNNSIIPSTHPHELVQYCECGDTVSTYHVLGNCSVCKSNLSNTTNQNSVTYVFTVLEGDSWGLAPLYYEVDLTITYLNQNSNPRSNSAPLITDLPVFASFYSSVSATVDVPPSAFPPTTHYTCSTTVPYYSSSNNIIATQTLSGGIEYSAIGTLYTLSQRPSYTKSQGSVLMENAISFYPNAPVEVTTYFN